MHQRTNAQMNQCTNAPLHHCTVQEAPRDFPKALYAGAPFQLAAFMTVGCVGYRYLGDAAHGLLINAVPPGAISP
tara:strand:- start:408 stop:632 length:225 start_codon:yes stop_codon:yes gene_type:complete